MVSIIVPVYNTEKYLHNCIDSLLAQTCTDIEILLVNDGSTDGSGAICDAYAARDARIRVMHQQNGGVSSARNAALAVASGEYIAFVDSDDWVSPHYIEAMLDAMTDANADLVCCGMFFVRNRFDTVQDMTDCREIIQGREVYRTLLCDGQVGGYLCNKLFKRDMIAAMFDPDLHVSEDFVFCAQYAKAVGKTVILRRKMYYYWQNPQRKHGVLNARMLSLLNAQEGLLALYATEYPSLCLRIKANMVKAALNMRARYELSGMNDGAIKARLDSVIGQYYDEVYQSAGKLSRLNLALTRKHPALMLRLKMLILGRK